MKRKITKTRKRKTVIKKELRALKKTRKAAKKSKGGYNPQTGRPTGRAIGALERVNKLAEEYQAQGMSAEDALSRAYMELRAHGRRDWRGG